LQSTHEPNTPREARKTKLREKREKAESSAPKDDKIQIVTPKNFTELHQKFNLNNNESSDSETDAEDDTVVNRLAIAKKMLRKKDKHQIIDDSYNRWYKPDDEDAPMWFLKEEAENWTPPPVISNRDKHEVRTTRDPNIEVKQFKKVLEAKMRRKKRLGKKLDKIKKKAENLDENDGNLNNRVLNAGLRKIQSEWTKTKKSGKGTEKQYVVMRNGRGSTVGNASKKAVRRTKVKMVDARMKKDKRNDKLKSKNLKRKRK